MKHGKKYVDSFKAIDKAKQYDAPEALELAAKGAKAKFDETIELHIRLGVDSRHADQQVRGAVEFAYSVRKTSTRLLRQQALTMLAAWISLRRSQRKTGWISTL